MSTGGAARDGAAAAAEDARRALSGQTTVWYRTQARLPADMNLRSVWLATYAYTLTQALTEAAAATRFAESRQAGCTGTGFSAEDDTITHNGAPYCPVHHI